MLETEIDRLYQELDSRLAHERELREKERQSSRESLERAAQDLQGLRRDVEDLSAGSIPLRITAVVFILFGTALTIWALWL